MRPAHVLIVLGLIAATTRFSTAQAKHFSISAKGSLTTGSQLFPNPNSPDEFQRAQFYSLKDIWGFGVEVRYRFPETDLALALSADYLRKVERSDIRVAGKLIPEEDGYRVIPVELTGYFIIPISGEQVGVYIGGGAGVYFGRRVWRRANVEATTIDAGNGYGIHVLSGVSYRFTDFFSLNAEMKFRDLQFESVNQFPVAQTLFGSTLVTLPTQIQTSRVHTDGMIFQLGAVIDF
jgi:opacity protein-like surface antigen